MELRTKRLRKASSYKNTISINIARLCCQKIAINYLNNVLSLTHEIRFEAER
jgi:hypothetical protein